MAEKELRLKVGELTAREEAGRGVVRIDAKLLKELGIREGDVVEVEGKRKTAALAFRSYPADVGLNIIRMDGITRRNAETGVGEFVKIRAAETKEARRITLAPAEKGIIVHISPNLIKQNIFTRPMVEGDLIVPSPVVSREGRGFFEEILGFDVEEMFFPTIAGETRFIVTRTEPSGIVRVGDITQVEILRELPEALKARERIPAVTYEDVGGIKPIVTKIREMIELPLRHPELFERLGVEAPKGVLLHGPPGTGKTLLAKAVANESGANFISISGPEIFSKWYGQSLPGSELVWIVDNGMVKRVPIKDVVESGRKGLKTICFNEEGKVDYGDIVDFIKHKNGSKILEIRTASGRRIKVTDYHSLFTLNGSKIEAIKTSDLVAGKSFIAIPRKIPWPEKAVEEIDLLDELKENDYGIKVMGVGQYIREAIRKVGHGRAAEILGYGSKYLYDVINKNIRIPVSKFLTLMREAEIELDKENIRICTKGKSLPAKLKLNKEFLTFLGLWVAEGSYTNKLEPRLSLNENEIKEVKELCEKLFGRVTVYQKENSKGSEIHINSSILG
ncbi:MAG: AAA family ATPase, partial [Candidatus Aenigmarchaeota archaeon]|nr:AAA family ATPase [Candidatus Aenigmarchaeota archaeon]